MVEVRFLDKVLLVVILGFAYTKSCVINNTEIRCIDTFPKNISTTVVGVFVSQLSRVPTSEDFNNTSWEHITTLDITLQGGDSVTIYNYTFVHLKSLKYLGLHGSPFKLNLERFAFSGLDIHHLDLSGCSSLSEVDLKNALSHVKTMPSLSSLILNHVNTRDFNKIIIDAEFFQMLHHKRNLTNISLHATNLIFDGRNITLSYLSNNVKHLDVSSTSFIYQAPDSGSTFSWKHVFPSLETLNISFSLLFKNYGTISMKNYQRTCLQHDDTFTESFVLNLNTIYAIGILDKETEIINTSLDLSNCMMKINTIKCPKNNIRILDFHVTWPDKKTLVDVDLSFNNMEFISPYFLNEQTHIAKINLGNNKLFKMERSDLFSRLFETLVNLEKLRLSQNQLETIPHDMFLNNKRLRVLDLSGNSLKTITFKLAHLAKLEYLDLSNNNLKTISGLALDRFESLLQLPNLKDVNLAKNVFECTCDNYPFIELLYKDIEVHDKHEMFQCNLEGHVNNIDENVVSKTKFLCYKLIVIVSCSLLVCTIIFLLVLGLVLRHKRNVIKKTDFFLNGFITKTLGDIQWLGMMSYSSEDGDIVTKHIYNPLQQCLKTMLDVPFNVICNNEIDFHAGMDVAAEIVRCISESCVLIVAVSETYCRKHWCSREVEEAYKQGKPIILVFLEDVDEDIMQPFLRKIFQRYTRVKLVKVNGEYTLLPKVENVSKSIISLAEQSQASDTFCLRMC